MYFYLDKSMQQKEYNVDLLNGYDFEDLVARIMKKVGYKDIVLTPKSNDKGKDIIMKFHDEKESYPVIVECKHQNFVGRPVVQKLQGAMLHEGRNNGFIKGIIVTSGKFAPTVEEYIKEINRDYSKSMEIELIDGKKLKKLCEKYDISILNGKIQIITNNSTDFLEGDEIKNQIHKEFNQVIGHKEDLLKFESKTVFYPCYYIKYNIDSEFCTSVGCVNKIQKQNEEIFLDGVKAEKINNNLREHFFGKGFPKIIQIKKSKGRTVIPFEFTEKDIEDVAFETIVDENTEKVKYYGKNNVGYTKICRPNYRDIELKDTRAIYLPKIINQIKIKDQNYLQEIFSSKHNLFYEKNELGECKSCKRNNTLFDSNLYFCRSCGRILCSNHKRLDAVDKTPVCLRCAFKKKLIIQTKFFITKKNKNDYLKEYAKMNFFRKFYEDKIAFWGSAGLVSLILIAVLSNL